MKEHRQVYWDEDKKAFYWIEWEDLGNREQAHKHYINYK